MLRVMCAVAGLVVCVSLAQAGLLAVPESYTPDKSWPVVVSFQDNPSEALMAKTRYFLVHSGDKGLAASAKAVENLKGLAAKYNIDPMRIYGTGFSRGGQEVLEQAWLHPDWFAAIVPVCNDLREKPDRPGKVFSVRYVMTPTLLLHGDGDSFLETGKVLHGYMKEAGLRVDFATYPGGHGPDAPFKQDVKMLTDFFDKHVLNPYPKEVFHLIANPRCTRAFWADAVLLKSGLPTQPASEPATQPVGATFRVAVKDGNRIDVQASAPIAALDLYLNDKLVDMKKPVTVTMGEKTLFEGPAASPLTVKVREGEPLAQPRQRTLWEELEEIRAKTKYTAPAKTSAPATRPAER